jgi:hypothetical protein
MAWNKMNLEFNSRRGLFNAKRPKICNFYLTPSEPAPQGDLRSKNT